MLDSDLFAICREQYLLLFSLNSLISSCFEWSDPLRKLLTMNMDIWILCCHNKLIFPHKIRKICYKYCMFCRICTFWDTSFDKSTSLLQFSFICMSGGPLVGFQFLQSYPVSSDWIRGIERYNRLVMEYCGMLNLKITTSNAAYFLKWGGLQIDLCTVCVWYSYCLPE